MENNVEEIIQAMSNHGWRITDQRKTLAVLFAESDEYFSPREVYEYMKKRYPGVSYDTIYRNLRLLHEMGVLEQFFFEDGVKFKALCHTHHHHHLICLKCQKTYTFKFCPMKFLEDIPADFDVVNHKFEVYGYCPSCQSEKNIQNHFRK
jgi:Fur family zinc uptake transcriptional regulator